jgi:hypothetical protein
MESLTVGLVAMGAALGATVAWATALFFKTRRQRRELHEHEDRAGRMLGELATARRQVEELGRERDNLYWLKWWVRNAVETPHHDPARLLLVRWSIAACLAPSLDQLHSDLLRIADDATRSESERVHARAFASELRAEELPWVQWRTSGRPEHNREVMAAAYRAALDSWLSLLPGAVESVPASAPSTSR